MSRTSSTVVASGSGKEAEDRRRFIFEAAVERNDQHHVQGLLRKAPVLQRKVWAFQWAAWRGDIDAVRRHLPDVGADANNSMALVWAAAQGHADLVDLLIPVSDPCAQQSRALIMAASHGHTEVVRRLIQVGDPSAQSSQALFNAARNGHVAVVLLLRSVSSPKVHADMLADAARRCSPEIVDALLPGAPAYAKRTGLINAALNGRAEIVRRMAPVCDLNTVWQVLLIDLDEDRKWSALDLMSRHVPLSWVKEVLLKAPAGAMPQAQASALSAAVAPTLVLGAQARRPRL